MRALPLAQPGETLRVLALGAHSDDIEIGAGGAILSLIAAGVRVEATWCVFTGEGVRAKEAEASARDFLDGAARIDIALGGFRDGFLPYDGARVKEFAEALKARTNPDVIFTHWNGDAHQDHRLVSELTWNTFRDHAILEYEIPKWDGDLGRPNAFVALSDDVLARKIALLTQHFGSQRSKAWFDGETFRGLARLRGVECRAQYAEAFFLKKARIF
jgi:LmbE family N-acetylglucosaminyl deacetylase